jgi:hypothetical protein
MVVLQTYFLLRKRKRFKKKGEPNVRNLLFFIPVSCEELGSDMRRSINFPKASVLLYSTSRLKPLWPHTQSETGLTWPTSHRSVSPLARSLNVAVVANTAADYRCCSRWKEAKVTATKQAQG